MITNNIKKIVNGTNIKGGVFTRQNILGRSYLFPPYI